MLKISRLTDYAVVMLSAFAASDGTVAAADIAQRTGLPGATVAKVLKRLAGAGIVSGSRGVTGGYRLARPLAEIALDEVIAAIDGPIRLTACVTHKKVPSTQCKASGHCALSGKWAPVNAAVTAALAQVSLAQLGGLSVGRWAMNELARAVEEFTPELAAVDTGYRWGFESDIASDTAPPGLSEATIRFISAKKEEPQWLLDWRLAAYAKWLKLSPPDWAKFGHPPVDFQAISYYSQPKKGSGPKSLAEVDPELLRTYEKLGIPLHEREILAGVERPEGERKIAIDAVFDSVSVATTFKAELARAGVIFCPISEAVREHPELVRKYLGSVVPADDNFYACLNSAVFTDGSFVYIPPGVRCPMELSTYFRINAKNTGQFERTLIVADAGSQVSYLEGCTAPQRDENQLHAAVVELVLLNDATIKYSTVQNWYPGDAEGRGGIYNFVTKRAACRGARSRVSWTQVETGSAITWKYPSCVLQGEGSIGEFYSVALTKNCQLADTGTKMIHIGANTRSTIVSKGISAGRGQNTYRGLVRILPSASGARNHTQCDSLLIGPDCGAHTVPYIECRNPGAVLEHEATTSKISEDQLFYLQSRGIPAEDAVGLIVNGFCHEVLQELPMEFAVEAQKLLALSLEGSVG